MDGTGTDRAPSELRDYVADMVTRALWTSCAPGRRPGHRGWIDDLARPWTRFGAACVMGFVNELMGGLPGNSLNEFNYANSRPSRTRAVAVREVLRNIRATVPFRIEAWPGPKWGERLRSALDVLDYMLHADGRAKDNPIVKLRPIYEEACVKFEPEQSQ